MNSQDLTLNPPPSPRWAMGGAKRRGKNELPYSTSTIVWVSNVVVYDSVDSDFGIWKDFQDWTPQGQLKVG